MYCLDTNTLSYFLRGDEKVRDKIFSKDIKDLCITVFNFIEIKQGLLRNGNNRLYEYFVSSTKSLTIFHLDDTSAEEYVNINLDLIKRGKPIPIFDIFIAAVCKSKNITLVTNDKHFKYVKKLKIENWCN